VADRLPVRQAVRNVVPGASSERVTEPSMFCPVADRKPFRLRQESATAL